MSPRIEDVRFGGCVVTPGWQTGDGWAYAACVRMLAVVVEDEVPRVAEEDDLPALRANGWTGEESREFAYLRPDGTEPPTAQVGRDVLMWAAAVVGAAREEFAGKRAVAFLADD